MMKFHIYLFRHGETYYNRSRRFTGWVNSRLTPRGLQQSSVVAEKLRNKQFQVAFRTRLHRSAQSLRVVLRYHPECQRVLVDDRMIERSYGTLERKFHKTVIEQYGREQFDVWHRSYATPPPGGESIAIVERRVLSFVRDLLLLMKRDRVNAAISAHGNSMRPFRRYFENLTIAEMMDLENPYDEYFDYVVES